MIEETASKDKANGSFDNVTVIVVLFLVTLFYYLEFHAGVLAAIYGIFAADFYNRSAVGQRIRVFFKGNN